MAELWLKWMLTATFSYLGNTLISNGGCESPVATRFCVAWNKLRKPCLSFQALFTKDMQQGVCGYAPLEGNVGTKYGSTIMTMPWSTGSVSLQTQIKHPPLHYYKKLALRILEHFSQSVTHMVGTGTASRADSRFAPSQWEMALLCNLAGVDSQDRDACRNDIWHSCHWCFRHHRMEHRQHFKQKWIWMDGNIQNNSFADEKSLK